MRRLLIALTVAAGAMIATGSPGSAQPQPLLGLETGGHMALIRAVVFTPDGSQLISGADDKVIRIWDVATGNTLRTLRGEIGEGAAGKIYALAISPDGRWLAAAGRMRETAAGEHPIRLYDLTTGDITALLHGHTGAVLSLAFSPDGRLLASGSTDDSAIIWDVAKRSKLRQLKGHTADINRVAFTLDGDRLATAGDDRRMIIWRVRDGALVARSSQFRGRVFGLAVSPITGEIALSTQEGEIALLDDRTARNIRSASVKGGEVMSLTFSPDGRSLLTGAGAAPYHCLVFDVERAAPVLVYRGHQHLVVATAISPDGRLAVTAGGRDNEIHLWEMQSGALVRSMRGTGAAVTAVGFSGDGKEVAFGQASAFQSIHDRGPLQHVLSLAGAQTRTGFPRRDSERAGTFQRARTEIDGLSLADRPGGTFGYHADLDIKRQGKRIATIRRDEKSGFVHNAYSFTPDGKAVIAGAGNGFLSAHAISGAHLGELSGHLGDVWAVATSPDGRLLVSGADDQTMRLWSIATRELIVTLFHGRDGEWVMWTPQGYYASSPNGDALVGWHINRGPDRAADFITARQLRLRFFRPDIVDEAIRRASAKAAAEGAGDGFQIGDLDTRLPPEIEAIAPAGHSIHTAGRAVVTLALADDARDPVQDFTITVGGRRVPATPAEPNRAEPPRALGSAFATGRRVAFEVPLSEGSNLVRISARNSIGESRPVEVLLKQRGEGALDGRGTLYILAVGVDNYLWGGEALPNLRYARADAVAFQTEVRRRFADQHSKVESRLLVTGAGGDLEPSQANIIAALGRLSQAQSNDTVVVFLAGHGENDGDNYLFLPADAARKDKAWRADSVVPWSTLIGALARTAGRRLLFVDTCRSANAFNFRLIKDAADADVIAYSATNRQQDAHERDELGHGVFTHAVLEGLAGAADTNRDKVIRVLELGSFLSERVLELTQGAQTPDFYRAVGSENFVLVRL